MCLKVNPYVIKNDPSLQAVNANEVNGNNGQDDLVLDNVGENEINVNPNRAEEAPSSLTSRLREMILNATERNVKSLDIKTVRAETKGVLNDLKAEIDSLRGSSDPAAVERLTKLESLSKSMGKDLQALCKNANRTFSALGKLKGSDIAQAFIHGSCKWVPEVMGNDGKIAAPAHYEVTMPEVNGDAWLTAKLKEVANTVVEALNEQTNLAEHIESLYKKTGCTLDGLYAMSTACLGRATEINAMINDLSDLYAKNDAGKLTGEDQENANKMLNMRAARLLPRYSTDMHGNDTTFDMLKTELEPIAKSMEALKAKVASNDLNAVEAGVFVNLKAQIATARAALKQAAENGICYESDVGENGAVSSRFIPEASVMKAVNAHLTQVEEELDVLQTKAYEQSALKLMDEIVPDLSVFGDFSRADGNIIDKFYANDAPHAQLFHDVFDKVHSFATEVKKLCLDSLAHPKAKGTLRGKINNLLARNMSLIQEAASFVKIVNGSLAMLNGEAFDTNDPHLLHQITAFCNTLVVDEDMKGRLDAMSKKGLLLPFMQYVDRGVEHAGEGREHLIRAFRFASTRVEMMSRQMSLNPALPADGKVLLGLLNGTFGADAYVAAKTWGVPEEMINPELEDGNLISAEPLGSGVANTVYLCTYRKSDGTEQSYVFKPEISGRVSLDSMALNISHLYRDDQKVAELNFACKRVAEMFGTDSVMPEAFVGMHSGQFGLFMSVAKGVSGKKIQYQMNRRPDENDPVYGDFAKEKKSKFEKLSDYPKFIGSLAREFSNLEWNDIITGQGDRHWDNYQVSVDDDHGAHVVGVDNDVSFPDWRLGAMKFKVHGWYFEKFCREVKRRSGIDLRPFLAGLHDGDKIPIDRDGRKFLPGATFHGKDASGQFVIEIDLTPHSGQRPDTADKRVLSILKQTFGFQRSITPQFVSESIYMKLAELNKLSDDELKARLASDIKIDLTNDQMYAYLARVRNAYEVAEELFKAGRMKKDDEWETPETNNQVSDDWRQACAELNNDAAVDGKDAAGDYVAFLYGPLLGDIIIPGKIPVPKLLKNKP